MPTAESGSKPGRLVEVAVDAAGAGGARPFTYSVPESLADLEDGEAVLVEFGRRQALGVVLGGAVEAPSTDDQAPGRPRPGRRTTPAALDARTGALGRGALPGATGPRDPGDAAAGTAGTPRAGGRADPAADRRASSTPSTPTCSTSSGAERGPHATSQRPMAGLACFAGFVVLRRATS